MTAVLVGCPVEGCDREELVALDSIYSTRWCQEHGCRMLTPDGLEAWQIRRAAPRPKRRNRRRHERERNIEERFGQGGGVAS